MPAAVAVEGRGGSWKSSDCASGGTRGEAKGRYAEHGASALISAVAEGQKMNAKKNAAAVELGRLGGLKGGPARAKKLTSKQRVAMARHAANVRWGNDKKEKK